MGCSTSAGQVGQLITHSSNPSTGASFRELRERPLVLTCCRKTTASTTSNSIYQIEFIAFTPIFINVSRELTNGHGCRIANREFALKSPRLGGTALRRTRTALFVVF